MTKDPRRFYVYAFLREKDSARGKRMSPYYIGKGARDRATSKCRTIPRPSNSSFIVFVQEGLTEQEAFDLEKYCIALYGRIDKGTGILRNLGDGGDGASGVIYSPERRKQISEANKGRVHTEETKRKIGEKQKGEKNHMWRKDVSQETRDKISRANKGLKRSEEARRNIAQGKVKYLCELVDPQGNVHKVDNLWAFANENNLHYTMLSWLVKGKKKQYKKWICKSCIEVR
jgi:hypothetical protein